MQIILTQDASIDLIHDFFSFTGVTFVKHTLWNTTQQRFQIPNELNHTVLIIDKQMFFDLLKVPDSVNELIEFCNNSNQLWVFGQYDHAIRYRRRQNRQNLEMLNRSIKKSSLVLFLEAQISDRLYLNSLTNIKIKTYLNWHFMGRPRLQSTSMSKINPSHDYLLTMIKKSSAPHRDVLWNELCSRPGLVDRGLVSYQKFQDSGQDLMKSWLGNRNKQHSWQCGHASMDLYLDCYLELVPETCYKDIYFFTEKTQKPIMAQTPFLIVSNAGYLTYLQNLGFKTFGSLISEKYDQCYRVEDRAKLMIDTLHHIIDNGTQDFYQASKHILQHNFLKMCEIAGKWNHEFDSVIWQALDEFDHN